MLGLDRFVQGAGAVQTVVVAIRTLYDYQEFNSAGPHRDNDALHIAFIVGVDLVRGGDRMARVPDARPRFGR
jgi:hypothetical protein